MWHQWVFKTDNVPSSTNNQAQAVLTLSQNAVVVYDLPSRVRGDHGIENVDLARLADNSH